MIIPYRLCTEPKEEVLAYPFLRDLCPDRFCSCAKHRRGAQAGKQSRLTANGNSHP